MKKWSLALVLMMSSLSLFAQNEADRATQLIKQKKYKQAITLLEEAIATHPDWYYPVLQKANCNMRLKKYQEAIDGFKFVLSMELPDKEIPKVRFFMGRCYMLKGNFGKAIELFTALAKVAPENKKFDMYYNLGQAQVQMGRKAQKSKKIKSALDYFSKSINSFSSALKHPAGNQEKKLKAAFQKAYAQFKIGNLPGSQASLEKSITFFKDVLKIDPKHKKSHELLIEVSFRLARKARKSDKVSRYAQVVMFLDDYLKFWPNDLKMLDKKGQAQLGVKRYSAAVATFKKLISKDPGNGGYYFSLGRAEMADHQYSTAINTFNKALTKGQKKNVNVYSFIAYCYRKQQDKCDNHKIPLYQKASAALKQGLAALPGNAKLKKELKSNDENLSIFTLNYKTEEDNRAAMIDNIKSFDKNINGNQSKLEREREKQLKQNTPEIQKSIADLKRLIRQEMKEKEDEIVKLKTSYKIASQCGAANGSKYYDQMIQVLKANNAL